MLLAGIDGGQFRAVAASLHNHAADVAGEDVARQARVSRIISQADADAAALDRSPVAARTR